MHREERIITQLVAWIDDNIHRPLKIDDVADRSGFSKWHLQRMFYRVMNKSLGSYIRDKKLNLAAVDLILSTEAIIDISLKYGYDSQQTFTRIFSRKYQIPPATFRKLNAQPSGYVHQIGQDGR